MRMIFLCLKDALAWCVQRTFIYIVCVSILSPSFQVISLRDQIKRRQQGVDGGKDVREGFMHVGSSCFCVCVNIQNVCRKVDIWVPWCVSVILTLGLTSSTCHLFQLQPHLINWFLHHSHFVFLYCHHSSDYPMVPPLA